MRALDRVVDQAVGMPVIAVIVGVMINGVIVLARAVTCSSCGHRFCVARATHARAQMLDVGDGLFEQLADMVVVKVIDHPAAVPTTNDEPEVAKQPQLLRYGRGLHADSHRKLVDRRWPHVQAPKDTQPTRRSERLHRLSDRPRKLRVEVRRITLNSTMSHAQQHS